MSLQAVLRRDFLSSLCGGFPAVALGHLLAGDTQASVPAASTGLDGGLHHRAKVKRVIQLFMNGGVSPMDTWDYKPALEKLDGQKLDEEPVRVQAAWAVWQVGEQCVS